MSNEARPSKNVKHCEYNYDKIHNNDNNNNEKNKKEWLGLQRLAVISPSLLITFPLIYFADTFSQSNLQDRYIFSLVGAHPGCQTHDLHIVSTLLY